MKAQLTPHQGAARLKALLRQANTNGTKSVSTQEIKNAGFNKVTTDVLQAMGAATHDPALPMAADLSLKSYDWVIDRYANIFTKFDKNKDGHFDAKELQGAYQAKPIVPSKAALVKLEKFLKSGG